jgi:ubiquinone/menaquinone biosynthesis C-methylase UbiE
MDLETLDAATAARVLRALEAVNGWLGGTRATLYHIERFAATWKPGETIRFIDWGTGGADIPRALVRWGRARGYRFEVVGVDSNPAVIEYARAACREYPEIEIVEGDLAGEAPAFAGATPGGVDYALSSLCLHHLPDDAIVDLLKKSNRVARRGLIFNDLKRSLRAWTWIWLLTRIGGAHPIVQNDGPLSVRRAFRKEELLALAQRAGLPDLKVMTHFGYRLTLAGAW